MKKRPLWLLTFGICFVFLFMSANTKAATPVQKWGQLKVSGTNIVNKDGKKVQLKGVSTHGIAWFPQYVNKSCFQSFKRFVSLYIVIKGLAIRTLYIRKWMREFDMPRN